MRIRCSKGLRINAFYGHFFIRSTDLLALPACDSDKVAPPLCAPWCPCGPPVLSLRQPPSLAGLTRPTCSRVGLQPLVVALAELPLHPCTSPCTFPDVALQPANVRVACPPLRRVAPPQI